LKGELNEFLKREKTLAMSFDENSNIEQKYETLKSRSSRNFYEVHKII